MGGLIDSIRANVTTIIMAAALLAALVGGVWVVVLSNKLDAARASLKAEQAAHAGTIANYRAASEQARADDLAHAEAIRRRDAAIAEETQHDLETKLAAARRDADAYAARLRGVTAGADQGSGDRTDMPGAANATGNAAGAGETTELDDARICAVNTVLAEGWRDWWARVSAGER